MLKRIIALTAVAAVSGSAVAQTARPAPQPQPIARALFLSNMDLEFRKTDSNRDGALTKKEIEDGQVAGIIARAQARKRALFAALDKNRNGVLDQAEFARMPSSQPAANGQPTIQRLDANRDNRVSLVEYRAGTLVNFDRMDADKDGVVTPAEMKAGGVQAR